MGKIKELLENKVQLTEEKDVDPNGVFMGATVGSLTDSQKKLFKFLQDNYSLSDVLKTVFVFIKVSDNDPDNYNKGYSLEIGKSLVKILQKYNILSN